MSIRKNVLSLATLLFAIFLLQPITGFTGSPFDFAVIGDTRIGFNKSLYKTFLSRIDTER